MSSEEPLRLLIADDHPAFRTGLRALLSTETDLTIVGEVSDGRQAVAAAADLQPDVVLMDLQMPELDGIESTRRIVRASPHIAVLVLTMFDNSDSLFAAVRAGARGYLLKGAGRQEIIRAVKAAGNGEAIFGPGIAQRVMHYFAIAQSTSDSQVFPELTRREREVLDLVAGGSNNTDITKHLGLSPKTVRNHISNIFTKLQVADRAQAIVRAREAGLGIRRGPEAPVVNPRH